MLFIKTKSGCLNIISERGESERDLHSRNWHNPGRKHEVLFSVYKLLASLSRKLRKNKYLCINARWSSLALTTLASLIVDGGVKQSHWITIAFWRDCNRCCSATSDDSSFFTTLISRDLDKTLFQQIISKWTSCLLQTNHDDALIWFANHENMF